jgi:cytochrome c oxidase cbb3-type subunit 3
MSHKRDELLDHEVDGIREFDNDLPRWWLYGFYFTIAIAALYLINFHVLRTPLVGAKTAAAEYEADVNAHRAQTAAAAASAGPAAAVAVLADAESLAKGKAIFESQTHPCQACHRPDLGGLVGPNLTDDTWLHGCAITDVMHSIQTGYPTRGMMPYGGGPALPHDELQQLASYILSKHGSAPANPKAPDPERDRPCP